MRRERGVEADREERGRGLLFPGQRYTERLDSIRDVERAPFWKRRGAGEDVGTTLEEMFIYGAWEAYILFRPAKKYVHDDFG